MRLDRHASPSVTYDIDRRDAQNMTKGIQETAHILAAAGANEVWTAHSDPVIVRAENGRISENDLSKFFEEVEGKKVRSNSIFLASGHLMGSCRMGDESTGAVGPSGELYGVEILFVGDG